MGCKKCKTSKCTCEVTTCINPLIYMFKGVFSLVGTDSDNLTVLQILANISKGGKSVKVPIGEVAVNAEVGIKYPVDAVPDRQLKFTLDVTTALIETLSGGISISNNKNLCCPDCKNGIYYLGGADNFLMVQQFLLGSKIRICCLEHATTIETWLKVLEATQDQYPCCNTDFNEAIQQWFDASSSSSANFYLDDLFQIGILESSSFNGYSGLGILFNYLQLNHPELTAEDYLNILGVIVNLGLVIQCNGCEMIMASSETYLKWVEATSGGGGGGPVPV
jgi:hypothetical protein